MKNWHRGILVLSGGVVAFLAAMLMPVKEGRVGHGVPGVEKSTTVRSVPRPQSPVPSFPAPSGIQTAPGAGDYDPTRFLSVMPARDLYSQEPRNESWAGPVETALKSLAARDLAAVLGNRDLHVDCRTTTCKYSWEHVSKADDLKINSMVRALYNVAGGGSGTERNQVILLFRGGRLLSSVATNDTAALLRAVQERRNRQVRSVRRNNQAMMATLFPHVPLGDWPKE